MTELEKCDYQNHYGVMQRPVSVQRLHILLNDVVPLYPQVDEASGLHLLCFPIENVMPRRLVLDCCKLVKNDKPLTKLKWI